jgi:hypothetical protein
MDAGHLTQKAGFGATRSESSLCLRFFDAGLSAIFQLGATLARVGKHD